MFARSSLCSRTFREFSAAAGVEQERLVALQEMLFEVEDEAFRSRRRAEGFRGHRTPSARTRRWFTRQR